MTKQSPQSSAKPVLVNSSFLISSPDGQTAEQFKANGDSIGIKALDKAYKRFVKGVVEGLGADTGNAVAAGGVATGNSSGSEAGIQPSGPPPGEEGQDLNNEGGPPSPGQGNAEGGKPPQGEGGSDGPPSQSQGNNGGGQPGQAPDGSGRRRHLRQIHPSRPLAPSGRRRLQVQFDDQSPDIYDFADTPCSDAIAVSKQDASNTNCITVFGKYRVYVGEESDVQDVYQRFANETRESIRSGGLQQSLIDELQQSNDTATFTIEGVSPVVDENFDAFVEITDDEVAPPTTATPDSSNTTGGADVASTNNTSNETATEAKSSSRRFMAKNAAVALLVVFVSMWNCC